MRFGLTLFAAAAVVYAQTIPMVFFALLNGSLVSLAGDQFAGNSVLSYRQVPGTPTKFKLKEGHPVTTELPTPGNVGFYGKLFGFGPHIQKQHLKLDERGALKGEFLSCEKFPGSDLHWIMREPLTVAGVRCFPINIFFHPAV